LDGVENGYGVSVIGEEEDEEDEEERWRGE
jgi:hypothetical protein